MPIITAIKQQQRRKDRYSIYVDKRYALSLSEQQLIEEKLQKDAEIDNRELARLAQMSEFGKVMDRCYNYISFRPRSSYEVRTYLRKKQLDDDLIMAVIERLSEQDALNDLRFAEQWASERREFNLHSRQRLQAELRQKGIDSLVIEQVLSQLPEGGEQQAIQELVRQRNLLNKYPDQRKLIQYLQGRGFRYGDIKAALEQLLEN